jgi:hypothetical protein
VADAAKIEAGRYHEEGEAQAVLKSIQTVLGFRNAELETVDVVKGDGPAKYIVLVPAEDVALDWVDTLKQCATCAAGAYQLGYEAGTKNPLAS